MLRVIGRKCQLLLMSSWPTANRWLSIFGISFEKYSTHEQNEKSQKKSAQKPSAATRPNLNHGNAENKLSVFSVAQ